MSIQSEIVVAFLVLIVITLKTEDIHLNTIDVEIAYTHI